MPAFDGVGRMMRRRRRKTEGMPIFRQHRVHHQRLGDWADELVRGVGRWYNRTVDQGRYRLHRGDGNMTSSSPANSKPACVRTCLVDLIGSLSFLSALAGRRLRKIQLAK
jgi:hypothetical protein